jgi:hypothetical protein
MQDPSREQRQYALREPRLPWPAQKHVSPQSLKLWSHSPDAELWQQAMAEDIEALKSNNTRVLTPLPPGRKAIDCHWEFALKHDKHGAVVRCKARLCGQGFSQRGGGHYSEVYASVWQMKTLRVFLALAVQDLNIHRLDIKMAFLTAHIKGNYST